jgi:signal transduction histidine kinase
MQVARVRLLTEVPETPLPAFARRTRVRLALLNVLQNALEATPRGGTVRLGARAGAGVVVITVKDEGPGMSPERMARAFDLHYSTRPGATGIGLNVARTLLESEGGHIVLASRPGEGTTAELSIPDG